MQTLEADIAGALTRERIATWLITVFAALAVGLAALGIYGVVAYSAAERSKEMGIRLALGAEPRDVVRHVVGEGARLIGIGIGAGVLTALLATRLLDSLLYGVGASDPATLLVIPVALGAAALVAAFVPARRAAQADIRSVLGDG